jgi:hypothetical protein
VDVRCGQPVFYLVVAMVGPLVAANPLATSWAIYGPAVAMGQLI